MKLEKINWQNLQRVFIAIDAANLEHSAKELNMHIRYKLFLDFFAGNTKLVATNFYSARFGSASHERFLTFLKKQGFRLITKPVKTIQDKNEREVRKANFDVEITADTLNQLSNFDTLLLFSGDSDFDYLIKLLKEKGKKVFVISSRFHISKELVASASRYFDLKIFKGVFLQQQKSPSFPTGS